MLGLAVVLAGCDKRPPEPSGASVERTAAKPAAKPRIEAALNEDVPKERLVKVGERAEARHYKLSVQEVGLCPELSGPAADAPPPADGKDTAGPARGREQLAMFVKVSVESVSKKLHVHPRHFRIASSGLLFKALSPATAPRKCGRLLEGGHVKAGEQSTGTILFSVNKDRASALTLEYRPQRWGGSDLSGVRLPDLSALPSALPDP